MQTWRRWTAWWVLVSFGVLTLVTPARATTYQWVATATGNLVASVYSGGVRAPIALTAPVFGRAAAWAMNPAVGLAMTVAAVWFSQQGGDGTSGYGFAPSAGPAPLPDGEISQPANFSTTYAAREHVAWGGVNYSSLSSWFTAWKGSQSVCNAPSTCTFTSSNPASLSQSLNYAVYYDRVTGGVTYPSSTNTSAVLTCPFGGTLGGSRPNMVCTNGSYYSCPDASWTLNGTTCTKSGYSASAGPVFRAKADGSGWQADPLSPSAVDPGTQAPPNPATISGTDPSGNPSVTTITPQAGGGLNVSNYTQTTLNNQTYTTHNSITINNAGAVTSNITKTTLGTVADAQGGNAPAGTPMQLPTDYARDATVQASNEKLQAIQDALTPEGAPDTSLATAHQDFETAAAAHEEVIDGIGDKGQGDEGGLLSWDWLPELPEGSCESVSFGVPGHVYTWDWCPVIAKIASFAGYALYIVTAWFIFATVTGRREGV